MAVEEARLREAIGVILSQADLSTISRKMVRQKLEEMFGMSLGDQKAFINTTIQEVMVAQQQQEEDQTQDEIDPELDVHDLLTGGSGNTSHKRRREEEEEEEAAQEAEAEEDEDDDDEDDDPAPKKKSRTTKKSTKKAGGTKRKAGTAFNQPLSLSPELGEFLGAEEMARPQIVKSLWEYIREHELQDPNNKQRIILDEKMRQVFQRDSFTMFSMNKYIKRHVCKPIDLPIDGWNSIERGGESSEEDEAKKTKKQEKKRTKKASGTSAVTTRKKNPNSGFHIPQVLSPELSAFLNEPELSRPEVVKRMWAYIKEKDLQNPENRKEILCDEALQKVFDQPKITMFSMNKFLGRHFIKKSA